MGEFELNNGFSLVEALLALMIVLMCIELLFGCVYVLRMNKDFVIDETIEKKWFYTD